ncbi:transcriptional regulator NanR [Amaricoccus tamworthensis]|uniref:transcriptional regulator NanR n=1 Tax=Amaricoccus tamworthensis TaxID=57002 RepID=UPI003C7DEC71
MSTPPLPIKRRKLSDEVKERILETIQRDALGPGDILPSERELMSLYGVGRPAIREAMQALQGSGLIEVRHGERPRVAEASMDGVLEQMNLSMKHILSHSGATLEQLKEARLTFETYLVGRAALERSEADLVTLREAMDQQRAARDIPAEFMKLDGRVHEVIAGIPGNPLYAAVSSAIFGWLAVFHVGSVRRPGLEDLTLEEHDIIFAAIRDRDARAAKEAMIRHLTRSNTLYDQSNARPDPVQGT